MAPASTPGALNGCTIALSGTFPGHTHSMSGSRGVNTEKRRIHANSLATYIGSLGKSIEDLDGSLSNKVTKACTHLVASEKDWDGGAAKGEEGLLSCF